MAVGFGTVLFSVYSPDGTLPAPVPDERGWKRYAASIQVGSNADVETLDGLVSTITEKPAIGMRNGGTVIVEGGSAGARTLTFPTPNGGERVFTAILTSIQPVANLLHADQWQVEATWLLLVETV